MPTEIGYRLAVEGPAEDLQRFRDDRRLWDVRPWADLFSFDVDESNPARLAYRYNDDYKRPSPSVERMARAYPRLTFVLEHCDEFGHVAGRAIYSDGVERAYEDVDPVLLDWIEWHDDVGDS